MSADEAVADLYRRTYPRLVGLVALAASSRAEAEECVQDAFIRLLSDWDRIRGYDDPEGWVRLVAFRQLSNRRRKLLNAARAALRLDRPAVVPGPDPDRVDVAAALRELPLPQRQVIVLHHLVGLRVEEVAAALQVPVGTVKSRLSRARTALAPLLTEESTHV